MQAENTELNAVERLLEHGVKVPVKAPLLFKVFGKRQINVSVLPPTTGTLYRISGINLKAGLTPEVLDQLDEQNTNELHAKYSWPMHKVAALGILGGSLFGLVGLLFMWPLAFWLRWHVEPRHLLMICKTLNVFNGKSAFTTSIRYVSGMTITTPKLSQ